MEPFKSRNLTSESINNYFLCSVGDGDFIVIIVIVVVVVVFKFLPVFNLIPWF